jgi:hypothetical protein
MAELYVKAPESISTTYFIRLSLPVNTFSLQPVYATIEELLYVCLWAYLSIPLSLLGNDSVKIFQRKRRIFGGVTFYAALVVSKESRRSVLSRTDRQQTGQLEILN